MNNQRDKHRAQAIIYSSIFCILVYVISSYILGDRWDLYLVLFPLTIFLVIAPFFVIISNLYLLLISISKKNYFHITIASILVITALLPLLIANKKQQIKKLNAEQSIKRMNEEGKAQEDYIRKLKEEGRLE